MPVEDSRRRGIDLAEAAAFPAALLGYLWWLAIPWPWAGVLLPAWVAASWRRRRLTPGELGLGWNEFRASLRRWGPIWFASVVLFAALGGCGQLRLAVLTQGAVSFGWAAAQQVVYQSMAYLPLRAQVKWPWQAAALAGLAFAALHAPNPVLTPATYLWAAVSSLLFERCRTIWGLALLQTMLGAALFGITPPEWSRNFRIGPYY